MTDLSASRSRLDEIDRRAEELLAVKAASPANIRARVKAIHDRSDTINKLRQAKERSLQGANRCARSFESIKLTDITSPMDNRNLRNSNFVLLLLFLLAWNYSIERVTKQQNGWKRKSPS